MAKSISLYQKEHKMAKLWFLRITVYGHLTHQILMIHKNYEETTFSNSKYAYKKT